MAPLSSAFTPVMTSMYSSPVRLICASMVSMNRNRKVSGRRARSCVRCAFRSRRSSSGADVCLSRSRANRDPRPPLGFRLEVVGTSDWDVAGSRPRDSSQSTARIVAVRRLGIVRGGKRPVRGRRPLGRGHRWPIVCGGSSPAARTASGTPTMAQGVPGANASYIAHVRRIPSNVAGGLQQQCPKR
jgi:hypothetical protein